jgi:hypothetical protein
MGMASTIKRRVKKITFKEQLEKRRADLEELTIRTNQVSELRAILSQTIEDPNSKFGSEQTRLSILTEDESQLLKSKMISLIDRFFK